MPSETPKFPDDRERAALQLLVNGQSASEYQLHPAGLPTIEEMVEKGWIEQTSASAVGGRRYAITAAGGLALTAEIPIAS